MMAVIDFVTSIKKGCTLVANLPLNYSYQGYNNNNHHHHNENPWEYNPNEWMVGMGLNNSAGGFDLPPNHYQDGEIILGIALSHQLSSTLQSSYY